MAAMYSCIIFKFLTTNLNGVVSACPDLPKSVIPIGRGDSEVVDASRNKPKALHLIFKKNLASFIVYFWSNSSKHYYHFYNKYM